MPFDLVGFAEAAPGAGTVGIAIALADSLNTGSAGDNLRLRSTQKVILGAIYGAESTPGYLRIKQASWKYYLELIKGHDIEGGTNKPHIDDFRAAPIDLISGEDLNVFSNNATDEDTLVGLFLGDGAWSNGAEKGVKPDIIMRGIVDQALTAVAWTAGAVTWSQSLAAGRYAVVGLKAGVYKSANPGLTLVRLTGLDNASFRPGVVAQITGGDKIVFLNNLPTVFDRWPLMAGISFPHTALPNIEALSPYANTDIVLEMAIKKISD